MVKNICRFDGYEYFRNLHCFSRFCSDFCCSRFVVVSNGSFTPRLVKSVLKSRSDF